MLECLTGCNSVVWVIDETLQDKINGLRTGIRDQLSNACALFNMSKVELHVSGILLELLQEFFTRGAHYIVDSVYLV